MVEMVGYITVYDTDLMVKVGNLNHKVLLMVFRQIMSDLPVDNWVIP
jgi:hypothetical protein